MSGYLFDTSELPAGRGLRAQLFRDSQPLSYRAFITGLCEDPGLRRMLREHLAAAPFEAFRWETPCVSASTASRPFEYVVLDSPGLAARPEPDVFAQHFPRAVRGVVAFENLGGDARLVVPAPMAEASAYNHLARFVRRAPVAQQDALFRVVGEQMRDRIARKPVWLSTAGAGVYWLHVRLDDQPKYYGHTPYRSA
ncbi:MAG: hypothetical protein H6726_20475 [Sandaracinaceae bacterium]|nr:hypothetical protein [Sandaracinaceae bacterium]